MFALNSKRSVWLRTEQTRLARENHFSFGGETLDKDGQAKGKKEERTSQKTKEPDRTYTSTIYFGHDSFLNSYNYRRAHVYNSAAFAVMLLFVVMFLFRGIFKLRSSLVSHTIKSAFSSCWLLELVVQRCKYTISVCCPFFLTKLACHDVAVPLSFRSLHDYDFGLGDGKTLKVYQFVFLKMNRKDIQMREREI